MILEWIEKGMAASRGGGCEEREGHRDGRNEGRCR